MQNAASTLQHQLHHNKVQQVHCSTCLVKEENWKFLPKLLSSIPLDNQSLSGHPGNLEGIYRRILVCKKCHVEDIWVAKFKNNCQCQFSQATGILENNPGQKAHTGALKPPGGLKKICERDPEDFMLISPNLIYSNQRILGSFYISLVKGG